MNHELIWDPTPDTDAMAMIEAQVKRVADALEELVALAKEEE